MQPLRKQQRLQTKQNLKNNGGEMDKELEEYYSNFFELFRTKGWKQLIGEVDNNIEQLNNVEATKDEQDLFYRKGQLTVFFNLKNLEQLMITAKEQAESEDNEDDAI